MPKNTLSSTPNPLQVLAMGAGVQTTTLMMMSVFDELAKPHAIVFADLGWEPPAVYRNLTYLKQQAEITGIPFYTLSRNNIRRDAIQSHLYDPPNDPRRWASMPLFALDADGNKGILRRQCTGEYKVRPIDAFIRRTLLGIPKHGKCPPYRVHLWLGITTDEARRVQKPLHAWKTHAYPLIDLHMSRDDCHQWLDRHNVHHPQKSSCVGCPYRSDAEWSWMKHHQPEAFQSAVAFDQAIRNPTRLKAQLFLHSQRVPLDQVDFSKSANQNNQPQRQTECLGYCGT